MVRNAHTQAVQLDIQVTAVVVDQSGRMIALGRMDRARPITVDIALNKAYTAASFQQPTKDLAGVAGQTWFQSLVVSSSGRIMPGAGGTQRLLRAVGRPVAAMLLLTGQQLTGERAFQLGLVAALAAEGQALERATALARKAARMPPKAVAATRRVLRQGPDLPLDAALSLENREFLLLFDTADKTEGMRAFLDKRSAAFKGE